MYAWRHIVHVYNTNTVGKEKEKNLPNHQKATEAKLVKGLLDFIILQLLNNEPMHGYQIITHIRKAFGIYFGPSTIYPLLGTLEKKGCILSEWNTDGQRPRKIYCLTKEGQNQLNCTENSLISICKRIAPPAQPIDETEVTVRPAGATNIKEA